MDLELISDYMERILLQKAGVDEQMMVMVMMISNPCPLNLIKICVQGIVTFVEHRK